jgi:hypothetical protein
MLVLSHHDNTLDEDAIADESVSLILALLGSTVESDEMLCIIHQKLQGKKH